MSLFLSTLSLRRATAVYVFKVNTKRFLSTLSLRRATTSKHLEVIKINNFYPRSPCGERPLTDDVSSGGKIFLSTLSLRRATRRASRQQPAGEISIHALLAESDCVALRIPLPTSDISIHALLAESDAAGNKAGAESFKISIHALLAESDSKSAQNSGALLRI